MENGLWINYTVFRSVVIISFIVVQNIKYNCIVVQNYIFKKTLGVREVN